MKVTRLLLVLAAGALLLLQFADCMSAMTPDEQSMECCRTMPCTPANKSHDCCKGMASVTAPSIVPSVRVSLNIPAVVAVEYAPALEILPSTPVPAGTVEAQQHSPPDLYTLHASLLI